MKVSQNQVITYTAILSTIGFILNYIEIPYIIPYLKFDISEIVVLLAVQISLPIALTVGFIKGILLFILKSGDIIGVLTLITGSFVIAISYYIINMKIDKEWITLIFVSCVFVLIMIINAYFIAVPLYSGNSLEILQLNGGYFKYIIKTYLLFNIIKISIISVTFHLIKKKLNEVLESNDNFK